MPERIPLSGVQGTTDTAKTPADNITVGGDTAVVLAANTDRVAAFLYNDDSTEVIYLSLGGAAELQKGIRLNPEGGGVLIQTYLGEVQAIATGAGTVLTICEI